MLKIKYKAPLVVLTVTIIMTSISAYVSYTSNVKLIESAMQAELHTASALIQNDLLVEANKASAQAALVVNLPIVQQAVHAKDRDTLIKLLVPAFNALHDKYGVVQGHFHTPPATSLLRLRNLDKWGEDLSSSREMVLKANKENRALQGIEISSTGMNIRGIDVINDANGHAGTFESEVDFVTVLENLKRITGFESGAFVDDALMNKIANLAKKPDAERVIGGYRNVEATDWKKIRPIVTPDMLSSVNDISYKIETINGKFDGLVIVPLLDFKGSQIGSIVAVRSFETYQMELRANLVNSIAFALLQAIILSATLMVVINALLIRPLSTIDEKFHEVFDGNLETDISFLSHRNDEIGDIAKNVERLKKLLQEEKEKQHPKNAQTTEVK